MSTFLNNIIQRHTQASETVLPRVHTVFETQKVWPTPEFGLEEQTEESNLSNQQEHKNLSESKPIQQDDVQMNLHSQVHNPKDWPDEMKQEKMIGPTSITNNIRINKIENVDQFVTPPPNTIVKKEPVREERKHEEHMGGTKELDNVLAMLEVMKSFRSEPKAVLQKPDTRHVLPDFKNNQLEFSAENQTRKDLQSPSQPVIKIHIGKIEIKAEKEPTIRLKEHHDPKPALTLDQYLKERKVSHE
ncbi:MAG TPA: hypothetical protein VGK46_08245 [Saprospiraceae bacterium]